LNVRLAKQTPIINRVAVKQLAMLPAKVKEQSAMLPAWTKVLAKQ
jgi:hypothetical protein